MESLKSYETGKGGRGLKKRDALLNEKLKNVQWGEYRLGDLFSSENGDFDIQGKHINGRGEYVVSAGLNNSGVIGRTDFRAKIIQVPSITIDMFGNPFPRNYPYKLVTHARVFALIPKVPMSIKCLSFVVARLAYFNKLYSYENMASYQKVKERHISLPTKNGEIDFDFMESFVAELEAQRLAELEAYLTATNLKDCQLTEEEKLALEEFSSVEWGEYRVGELFEKVKTKKLPYKARDLPKTQEGFYTLPALTSSFQNQGLNYYVPKQGATILSNVISIPSNSDVYRAYYQSREFTVLSDAYAISSKLASAHSQEKLLFQVTSINKVTDLKIYSYKNKLGGWPVVRNKSISLPTKNGEIDFAYMETFIRAIQKLVIQDVVDYAERNIDATKTIITP